MPQAVITISILHLPSTSPHILTFKIKNPKSYLISLFCLIRCAVFPWPTTILCALTPSRLAVEARPWFHVKMCTAHFIFVHKIFAHLNSNCSPLFTANLFFCLTSLFNLFHFVPLQFMPLQMMLPPMLP